MDHIHEHTGGIYGALCKLTYLDVLFIAETMALKGSMGGERDELLDERDELLDEMSVRPPPLFGL